jgi:hypothetical protein
MWPTLGDNRNKGERTMSKWYNVKITFKTDRNPKTDERIIMLLGQLVSYYAYIIMLLGQLVSYYAYVKTESKEQEQ